MTNLISAGGLLLMLTLAYVFSANRRAIDFRLVTWGLLLQFIFALFILKTSPGILIFQTLSSGITRLARFGLRALLGGTLATFMTASIAGILI